MSNTNDNDIDALLDLLTLARTGFIAGVDHQHAASQYAALTALVAERDKLVEDNASQTYKGNSVRYWHDKASAYKATIGSLWEILESAAVRPDGERTITAVLTALIAERDALQQRVEYMKALNSTAVSIISERDALRQRVSELESQEFTLPHDPFRDADRELRGRLVCAALTGVMAHPSTVGNPKYLAEIAVAHADAAIAAMRKGDANAE